MVTSTSEVGTPDHGYRISGTTSGSPTHHLRVPIATHAAGPPVLIHPESVAPRTMPEPLRLAKRTLYPYRHRDLRGPAGTTVLRYRP
jgi:hypothetical protein